MIIECPACGARAKLPDNKEGAKVRCTECERVYVARDPASRRSSSTAKSRNSSAMPIGIGAAVIAVVMVIVMNRDHSEAKDVPKAPPIVPNVAVESVDPNGWESELVLAVRGLHKLAAERDGFNLSNQISFPHVWARLQVAEGEEIATTLDVTGYEELVSADIDVIKGDVINFLHSEEGANLPGNWTPFDGSVIAQDDETALIRLAIEPRDEAYGVGTRNIEWRLVKDGGKWKAWYWERYISPDEAKSMRTARKKSYKQKTLTDGSIVIEGEPKPIPYMEETSLELRTEIDALIAKLIDLELPAKELSKVRGELELQGKHAIPPLLTTFYHMSQAGFPDMDAAIQAQIVHQMLGDLTGYVTSFKAHDALGATQERRDSGVRQWWGWYEKHFKKFEAREESVDGLEENLKFGSERERAEYERSKRMIEQEEADKALKAKNKDI
ncbi:MAG: putative Zn finger-like uncharacterized protein [Planctomycetota bacterium]|jgi:predicted Zn finger-like uncharacterized protein